jgi:hypothetical protein
VDSTNQPGTRRVLVDLGRSTVTGTALRTRNAQHGEETLVQAAGRLAWVPSEKVRDEDPAVPAQRDRRRSASGRSGVWRMFERPE